MTLRTILGRTAVVICGAAALLAAVPASSRKSTPAGKPKPASKTIRQSKTVSKKPAVSKSRPMTASRTRKSTPARRSKAPVYRRSFQSAPTPERYRQIQEALQAKGHFSGTPNGSWGADSVDALKRFQQEQSLEPTGKINSLSLIALGLGPKHEKVAAVPSAPAEASPAATR